MNSSDSIQPQVSENLLQKEENPRWSAPKFRVLNASMTLLGGGTTSDSAHSNS